MDIVCVLTLIVFAILHQHDKNVVKLDNDLYEHSAE